MNHLFLTALLALLCLTHSPDPPASQEKPTRLRVHLVDGGRLVGDTSIDAIALQMEFTELKIPLEKVRRIDWMAKSRIAKVELRNGDQISGRLAAAAIPIKALFGEFDLRCEHLRSLERLPPGMQTGLPIHQGLVAYYSFDHGSEALGVDDATEQFRAEVQNAAWVEEGYRGGAVDFGGSASLTVAHDERLNLPQGLTLAAWVFPRGEHASYGMIMGKTQGSSWNGGYGLVQMSGDAEHVYFFVNNYSSLGVKVKAPRKCWSHIAGTFDGRRIRIYLNGQEAESLVVSGKRREPESPNSPRSLAVASVTTPLMMGSDASGYFWNGKLDDAALFDRALSAEEIATLYEMTAQESPAP